MKLIKKKIEVHAVKKNINWFEFDEPYDFDNYKNFT